MVAEATPTVFQVGFEQTGDIAQTRPALLARHQQPLQPHERTLAPLFEGGPLHLGGQLGIAGEAAHRKDRGGRVEVVARQLQQRLRRMGGLAELQAGVPHRVPQPFGHLAHRAVGSLVRMQQHDVDVAAGGERAARIATGGEQCPTGGQVAREVLEPRIGLLRQPTREPAPGQIGIADQLGADTLDSCGVDRPHETVRSPRCLIRRYGCAPGTRPW